MSYHRKNFLKRVIRVQMLVRDVRLRQPEAYLKEIYWQHVEPEFQISYRTFCRWLNIPAEHELKLLTAKEKGVFSAARLAAEKNKEGIKKARK